jgi:branched-chain amino acid transport system permease protein
MVYLAEGVHEMHNHHRRRLIGFAIVGILLFLLSNRVGVLRLYQGSTVSMYVIAIGSIVLLTGFSGQISLGNGAFMALGAYIAVLLQTYLGLPLVLTFFVAVLGAAFFGLILGVAAARLSGPYLAGTTLALAVALPSLVNQFPVLGGEQGLMFNAGSAPEWLGEVSRFKWLFWISTLTAIIACIGIQNILKSRYGRTWKAVRSNSTAAELSGISSARSKVLAFVISAGVAGLAGVVLALTAGTVAPGAFPLSLSFALITGAVIAGISSLLPGSVVGAVVLVGMSQLVGTFTSRFQMGDILAENLKELIVSALLILAVVFTPNGPGEKIRAMREHRKHHSHGGVR